MLIFFFFFFQAEDGIRDLVRSRGLGDVYKRQDVYSAGGQSVFDVFDTSAYTFLEVERGGIAGNMIVATYTATGIFKPVSYTHLTLPTSDLV